MNVHSDRIYIQPKNVRKIDKTVSDNSLYEKLIIRPHLVIYIMLLSLMLSPLNTFYMCILVLNTYF